MGECFYPELSYKIVGLLYEIYNQLGYGYQEKYYQRAFKEMLEKNNINYAKELHCPLSINGKNIGRYYLDFLVDNKIVVELKIAEDFYLKHIKQVLGYLKSNNKKLGILVIITKHGIEYKRILN